MTPVVCVRVRVRVCMGVVSLVDDVCSRNSVSFTSPQYYAHGHILLTVWFRVQTYHHHGPFLCILVQWHFRQSPSFKAHREEKWQTKLKRTPRLYVVSTFSYFLFSFFLFISFFFFALTSCAISEQYIPFFYMIQVCVALLNSVPLQTERLIFNLPD